MTTADPRVQSPPTPPKRATRRPLPAAAPGRVWLAALAVGAVATVLAFLFAPASPPPPAVFGGDETLADDLDTVLDERRVQGLAVARFPVDDPDAVAFAWAGTIDGSVPADEDTPFETASVFKTVTAMTLADMVANGETTLDRTLAEVFPDVDFADAAVAGATLEDLATHHSGLPTAPDGMTLRAHVLPSLVLTDAYAAAPPPVEALETTTAGEPGAFEYSNLGFSVLGAALAAESGTPYGELVAERVLEPLGMDDTVVVAGVPEGGAAPNVVPGSRVEPWHNTAYAPAGITTWSTTADLTRLLTAVTQGAAPGMDALEPVHEGLAFPGVPADHASGLGDFDIGLAWISSDWADVGRVTSHSGGTLGTSTMVAFDDTHGVVVMANSMSVDSLGLSRELLKDEPEPLTGGTPVWLTTVPTVMMAVIPPVLLLSLLLRRRTLVTQRPLDRLRVVSLSLGSLSWLAAGQRAGDWTSTPAVLWALAVGAVAAALTVGVWHLRRAPTDNARWRWLHVPVFVLSVVFSLTLGSLMVWGLVAASA
ncbi:serine hydrolase domain-containing protein [Nocardiopsis sp. NPDC049922]|uniref:serine hydrolase domain-containing protein n=1 Tax=Nocardiopsis sp. NPDC049922 TaxID=3155157 RepID=UPI0033FE7B87